MKQPLYILSACSISAQHTYDEENFLKPVVTSDDGKLFVIDADYTKYVSPVAIRRMSRLLKRGITAGMKSLEDAGVRSPDAIIIGTARGSVTDMEYFLHEMIDMKEEALNPASFIQSTYNSVNGWLAMMTKSTGYNQTYVHRGFSFELTLFDAQLFAAESSEEKHMLVGGFEEMTPEYFTIRNKVGYYKTDTPNSLAILSQYHTPGSVGGEGAHFFTLSNRPQNSVCSIYAVAMLHHPSANSLRSAIANMLAENGLTNDDIDVLVSGMNGDSRNLFLMEPLLAGSSANTTIVTFKQFSGEYDTAAGFGLWLGHYIFKHDHIPAETIYKQGDSKAIKNMLICNVTIGADISLILLKG